MKNAKLCKKCFYGIIIESSVGEVLCRSCQLPMSVFIDNQKKGLYINDTDDTCYDFVKKTSRI